MMTDFEWPFEYDFPPFFTLQIHDATLQVQLQTWSDLFLKYLKHINKFNVNIYENDMPLFNNKKIQRKLKPETILRILEHLQSSGHAAPLDSRRVEWEVYWNSLEEYANMVYEWVHETGQTNTVCTLYELSFGENTENTQFHGVDEQILLKALRLLEQKGKCELIKLNESYGVKFF